MKRQANESSQVVLKSVEAHQSLVAFIFSSLTSKLAGAQYILKFSVKLTGVQDIISYI